MRATLLFRAALLVAPYIDAASAPTPGQEAKQRLETLKKRLPGVLTDLAKEGDNVSWLSDPGYSRKLTSCKPELRVLRRVSPNRKIKGIGTRHRELSRFLVLSLCPTDALNIANR